VGTPFFKRRKAGREAEAGAEATAASEFAATVAAPIPSTAMALRLADGRPLSALVGAGHGADPARTTRRALPTTPGGHDADQTTLGTSAWLPDPGLATAPPSDFGASGLDSDLPDHSHTLPDILTDLPGQGVPGPTPPALPPGAGQGAAAPTLQHIGRYALKALLGQGGLGRVHEAWDPLLSRTVAVKTLQFDLDVPTRVSLDGLFLNEARAVAGLSHPYIVTVYDAGLSAHGVYIAMERLRGRDLRQALAGGWQPTPAQAALLVRRVADALAYAHARGVVHCDIKPANIFLNKRGKPKVLDFGIARVAHGVAQGRAAGAEAAIAGEAGAAPAGDAVMGSPHYLAPEQLSGGVVDGRTDVYALGVVFHELLSGRKAFAGQSLAQITHAVLHHTPAPAHELQAAVPAALSAIAARAMARQPEDRYASAAEMAAALREWLAAQGGDAAGASATGSVAEPAANLGAGPRPPAGATVALGRTAAASAAGLPQVTTDTAKTAPWRQPRVLALAGAAGLVLAVLALTLRPDAPAGANAGAGKPAASGTVAAVGADTASPADVANAAGTETTADQATPPETPLPAGDGAAVAPAPPDAGAAQAPRPAARTAPVSAATRPARSAAAADPATATPAPPAGALGELRLAISPWGEVELNGRAMGTTPPLTRLSLPPGRHQVTVRNSDLPPYSVTVEVHADEPVTLRHRF
jgi:serine/threonine-protein kinase